eukprot:GHRR01020124.1.p1 GENE.GHRR01020124.1~~GHRR01020124.1.p1  ORF type:complete len:263 (+),score=65.81 GHRR01020124.1:149-937(+)
MHLAHHRSGVRLQSQTATGAAQLPVLRRYKQLPAKHVRCSASNPDADDIMKKYGVVSGADQPVNSSKPAPVLHKPAVAPLSKPAGNGTFILLLLNVALFILDHVLHLKGIQALYLNHAQPQWYQWITHAFCHANWSHLSMNLFNLCVFGKMVEETEGTFGVIFAYLITALGAAVASVFTMPAYHHGAVTTSLGASGAIFGLFAVSVLTRLSWDPRKLLEGAILGQFVVRQVFQEAKAQAAGGLVIGGLQVGYTLFTLHCIVY